MTLQPKRALRGLKAYAVPRPAAPIDLYLDGNSVVREHFVLAPRLDALDQCCALPFVQRVAHTNGQRGTRPELGW